MVSSSVYCDLMLCRNCRQMAHCLPFSRKAAVVPRKTGPNSKLRSTASCRRLTAIAHFDCLPQALHKPVLVTMLISKPAAVRKRTSANCKACSHLLPRPSAETKALQNALAASPYAEVLGLASKSPLPGKVLRVLHPKQKAQ